MEDRRHSHRPTRRVFVYRHFIAKQKPLAEESAELSLATEESVVDEREGA